MDTWNPWIAETHVRRARWWEIAGALIGAGLGLMVTVWAVTVILFRIGA